MKTSNRLLVGLLLPIAVAACGGGGGSTSSGGSSAFGGTSGGAAGSGGSPSVTCTNGTIVAAAANDYAFSSTITLPPVTVKSMSNLKIDWSGVTQDFLGHSLDPTTDLNTALIMIWSLDLSDFQKSLNSDSLLASNLVVSPPPSILPSNGATSAQLYDFTINGTAVTSADYNSYFDPTMYPSSHYTYLAAVQTGDNLGTGIRMLQSFQLDASSSNTTVTLTNTSTMLQYAANLHSLHPTGVPAGTAALTLDWTQLTTNALGATFIPTNITSAIVGHYTQTPTQLEGQFLNLQTIATDLYTADIPSGTVLDFTTLVDASGSAFPGIDSNGTWVVALICGVCRNPAPWYLTVLEPDPATCEN
jgi:hypothetical protein